MGFSPNYSFLMFGRFVWSSFKGRLSRNKISRPQSHKWRNSSQIHTSMFPSYPTVH
jgi:hypothetical protein